MLLSPEESQLLRSGATSLLIDFNITGISADLLPESIVRGFSISVCSKNAAIVYAFYFFYFLLSLSYLYGVFCCCFSFGIP